MGNRLAHLASVHQALLLHRRRSPALVGDGCHLMGDAGGLLVPVAGHANGARKLEHKGLA